MTWPELVERLLTRLEALDADTSEERFVFGALMGSYRKKGV